jgi:hypothetical protein
MKKPFSRFVCWMLKRHTIEFIKKYGGKIHNFYGINGAGRMCTCPRCGKSFIVYNRRVKVSEVGI